MNLTKHTSHVGNPPHLYHKETLKWNSGGI